MALLHWYGDLEEELDRLGWAEVVRHLPQPELVLQACTAAAAGPGTGPAARRQLTQLRSQQRRLIDAYQAGAIALAELESRQGPLVDRGTELERVAPLEQDRYATRSELERQISDFSQKVSAGLEEMTFSQRQELVRLVLEKVVVTDTRVELPRLRRAVKSFVCAVGPLPTNTAPGRPGEDLRAARPPDDLLG